jgi:hypothetical protein
MVERRQDGDWTQCAQCGAEGVSTHVRLVSPDMGIEPVPLCIVCRFTLYQPDDHDTVGRSLGALNDG